MAEGTVNYFTQRMDATLDVDPDAGEEEPLDVTESARLAGIVTPVFHTVLPRRQSEGGLLRSFPGPSRGRLAGPPGPRSGSPIRAPLRPNGARRASAERTSDRRHRQPLPSSDGCERERKRRSHVRAPPACAADESTRRGKHTPPRRSRSNAARSSVDPIGNGKDVVRSSSDASALSAPVEAINPRRDDGGEAASQAERCT